jgi:PPM family protein phosphatase
MESIPDRKLADTGESVAFEELVARFFEDEPRTAVRVEFGALSHRGLVRDNNEDHYLVVRRRRERDVLLSNLPVEQLNRFEQAAYTLGVADGLGGHAFGELASSLALRTAWDLGGSEINWPIKMNRRESDELKLKAAVIFRLLDKALQSAAKAEPRLSGMGTTLTVCYTTGRELFILHAGDSRAYLCRDGALRRLTRDHTRAQAMFGLGTAEPESDTETSQRHVLTNWIGGGSVEADVAHHRLVDGDRLLLCTDGLTNLVSEVEIAALLNAHPMPDDACGCLVDRALDYGGVDNVTVVLANFTIPEVVDTADWPAWPG